MGLCGLGQKPSSRFLWSAGFVLGAPASSPQTVSLPVSQKGLLQSLWPQSRASLERASCSPLGFISWNPHAQSCPLSLRHKCSKMWVLYYSGLARPTDRDACHWEKSLLDAQISREGGGPWHGGHGEAPGSGRRWGEGDMAKASSGFQGNTQARLAKQVLEWLARIISASSVPLAVPGTYLFLHLVPGVEELDKGRACLWKVACRQVACCL